MIINAIVDRIENGNAILLSNEMSVEISIPVHFADGAFNEGEILSLTIDSKGKINRQRFL